MIKSKSAKVKIAVKIFAHQYIYLKKNLEVKLFAKTQ